MRPFPLIEKQIRIDMQSFSNQAAGYLLIRMGRQKMDKLPKPPFKTQTIYEI